MTEQAKKQQVVDTTKIIHYIIVAAFMFLFKYLPTFMSMTKPGMEILGIFIGLVYGWCTLGMIETGLMAFVAIPLTEMFDLNSFLAAGMGNNVVNIAIFSVLFCFVLTATRISNTIVDMLFNLKLINTKPWGFLTAVLTGGWILGMTAGSFVALLVLMPMVLASCEKCGYDKNGRTVAYLMIAALMSSLLGNMVLPFKDAPLVILSVYTSMNPDFVMDMGKYLLFAIPLTIIFMIGYIFFVTVIFRVDMKNFVNKDLQENRVVIKFNKIQKVGIAFFAIFIVMVILPGFLPECGVKTVLNSIGVVGISCLLMVAMLLIKVDGEPLFNFREAAKNYSWDILLCLAACMPVVTNLTNEATGITPTLLAIFDPILGGLSPTTFTITIVVLVILLTNVLNNVPCALMFLPIIYSYAPVIGLDPTPLVIILIFASHMSFATPASSSAAQFLYASGNADKIEMMKAGGLSLIPMMIFLSIAALTWAQLIY